MDRVNPRLFDIVAVAGLFILLFRNGNLRRPRNSILRTWSYLVAWFSICAVIWAGLWFPFDAAGKFSLFYAAKYIEGLVCIYLLASIPFSSRQKETLHAMIVVGGVVVAGYALFERLSGATTRFVAEGKEIRRAEGTVFGCLGPTYFHIATFSTTACGMTIAFANKFRSFNLKLFFLLVGLFAGWPALVCGSRTGFGMMMIVLASSLLYMNRSRLAMFMVGAAFCMSILAFVGSDELVEKAIDYSPSIRRVVGFEAGDGRNSFTSRLELGQRAFEVFSGDTYSWQGWRLPFFGGGFYAVPQTNGGPVKGYRIGYGFHNAYVFPYEQAGWVGLILSAIFLFSIIRGVWMSMKSNNQTDRQFATGVWCVLVAFLPALWMGQIFWHGFGTENMNTFLVAILVLSTKKIPSS